MSKEYDGRDKMDIAAQAEQDLNAQERKFGYQDGTGFGGKTVGGGSTSSMFLLFFLGVSLRHVFTQSLLTLDQPMNQE